MLSGAASTLYPNIQLLRIHFSKGDCVFFKGKGGKLGDLSGAMSYPTFSGVNVYFVDYVTCCAGD